jgi:hypothetical protein
MAKGKKTRGRSEMKATNAEEEIAKEELEKLFEEIPKGELDKMFIQGLRLQLETILQKNPYFKGSRRGSEHMKLSREERRASLRFIRLFVKAYFIVQARDERAFRQN